MEKLTNNQWRKVPVKIGQDLAGKEVEIGLVKEDKPGWWRVTCTVNGWPHTYHVCAQDEFEAMLTLSKMRFKDEYEEDGFFPNKQG